MTDLDLLDAWRFDRAGRLSPGIAAEYARYLTEYSHGVGPLLDATTFSLRRFMIDNTGRWAPATLAICRRAFRSFYAWAVEQTLLADSPAAGLPAVSVPETAVRVATVDVRAALMAAALTVRDRALVAVLCGSGARRGEIAALTVGDVDMKAGTILIVKSKTGKPRTAPLDPGARTALADWLDERNVSSDISTALWLTTAGTAMKPDAVKTSLRRIAERSGVTWSPHDSRRAYATEWLRRGGSETGLMAAAGWASPTMVARYTRNARQELAVSEARRLFG